MSETNIELTEIKEIVVEQDEEITDEDYANFFKQNFEKLTEGLFDEEKAIEEEVEVEVENDEINKIVITDENYKIIQKMISKKHYELNSDAILTKSLLYYENNKARVLKLRREKYKIVKENKAQERYNKDYEKYCENLLKCRMCDNLKTSNEMLCGWCIVKKYGSGIDFEINNK